MRSLHVQIEINQLEPAARLHVVVGLFQQIWPAGNRHSHESGEGSKSWYEEEALSGALLTVCECSQRAKSSSMASRHRPLRIDSSVARTWVESD